MIKAIISTSWSDFYTEESQNIETSRCFFLTSYFDQSRPISNSPENCLYVCNCLFEKCYITSSNGGSIQFNNENGKFLAEFSTFVECYAKVGGGIFIDNSNSVVNCICTKKCHVTILDYSGQFLRSYVSDSNKFNYLIQSSVTSTKESTPGNAPIGFWYGKQLCESVNFSNYNVSYYSAFFLSNGTSQSTVEYCSFYSNFATFGCQTFSYGTSYQMKQCNIIENEQNSPNRGLIISEFANINISDCCIMNNKLGESGKIFYCNDNTASITVTFCTLPPGFLIQGSVDTLNALSKTSFIYGFIHTKLDTICPAEQDSIDNVQSMTYLTATIPFKRLTCLKKREFRPRLSLCVLNLLMF